MCGIFGVIVHQDSGFDGLFIQTSLATLAQLSESRGKDSSGLVIRNEADKELVVFKGAVTLNYLLRQKKVSDYLRQSVDSFVRSHSSSRPQTFAVMGHSRLVTNGSQSNDDNNQPVVTDGVVGIHNGIIVNDAEIWSRYPDIRRRFEIDTEVMNALMGKFLIEGWDVPSAISKTLVEVFGTVSAAFFLNDFPAFALTTNNGSLYVLTDEKSFFAFASEDYFLRKLRKKMHLDVDQFLIKKVVPGNGFVLDLKTFRSQEFSFSDVGRKSPDKARLKELFKTFVHLISDGRPQRDLILDPSMLANRPQARTESDLLEFNFERIQSLHRCTKCILPETFPFITFDKNGVCNYCENYVIKNKPRPIGELFDLVKPYRRSDEGQDCIIPFSGGRDSTYTLHLVKNVLKLNPVAFTYDWGMVNDLARRNIARVCGKLGVENIIVSADISWKRENIRRNILAWLKKPHLGMVPLFMAGDKFFFYYTEQVKKQTGLRLNIWGVNPLENTDFKVGFMGVPPDHHKKHIYSLSAKRQATLALNAGKSFLSNPGYLNRSIWDTLGSFISRSIVPHRDYYHLFDYYRWDEREIEKLVRDEYQWEMAVDTPTTWRIGDGTAAFYNYIYYTVGGFSEYETFRSNQIREGMLTREEGLNLVNIENRPRYASIKWYLDILGLDFEATLKIINSIPQLY